MNTLVPPSTELTVLRNARTLIDHEVRSAGEVIGKVADLFFDEQEWCIRYFAIETGGWLNRRRILISPAVVVHPDWDPNVLPVNLTKDQIRESPVVEWDVPLSRKSEHALRQHYGWPIYWDDNSPAANHPPPAAALVETSSSGVKTTSPATSFAQNHLRSVKEINQYRIHAIDGEIGRAVDFLIDDRSWDIRFVVIDSGNWLPGKKVVVSPWWIAEVNWPELEITVDLSKDSIKNSPDYDPDHPLTADYAGRLYDHYGHPFRARASGQSKLMAIESPAFENGCAIPRRYTRYGENRQPPLIFDRVPAETISLALLVDDPDAPKGNFTHWVAFNIDPHLSGLVEDSTLAGAQEGLNDSGRIGYTGPFPPSGEHRYFFRLYALDCILDLPSDAARESLIAAINGHIIAEAISMGRFAAPLQTIRKKN